MAQYSYRLLKVTENIASSINSISLCCCCWIATTDYQYRILLQSKDTPTSKILNSTLERIYTYNLPNIVSIDGLPAANGFAPCTINGNNFHKIKGEVLIGMLMEQNERLSLISPRFVDGTPLPALNIRSWTHQQIIFDPEYGKQELANLGVVVLLSHFSFI